jgi:prepilin peptidase CpaA
MPVQHGLIYASATLACAAVAMLSDVRDCKIPNRLTGPALLFGLLLHFCLGGARGLGAAALATVIAGGIFLVFYIAGGMGAGDVKLMAALSSLSATADVRNLLIATMILGAFFALALAVWRGALRQTLRNMLVLLAHHGRHGMAPHPRLNVRNDKTLRLPYAIPMGVAATLVFATHAGGLR